MWTENILSDFGAKTPLSKLFGLIADLARFPSQFLYLRNCTEKHLRPVPLFIMNLQVLWCSAKFFNSFFYMLYLRCE